MSPDDRQAWEDDESTPSDFTGVHPVKLAPDAESSGLVALGYTYHADATPLDAAVLVRERDEARAEVERLRECYTKRLMAWDAEKSARVDAEAREAALRKACTCGAAERS